MINPGYLVLAFALLVPECASAAAETGLASRYSDLSKTASGRKVSAKDLVAAHRTLPFGTRVKVNCPKTGKSVIVTIVDRGPFIAERIIDLSTGAAELLGLVGLEQVSVTILP